MLISWAVAGRCTKVDIFPVWNTVLASGRVKEVAGRVKVNDFASVFAGGSVIGSF